MLQRKKKDKLKVKPNQNIQLEECILQVNHANFFEFFSHKQSLCGQPSYLVMNDDFVFVGTDNSYVFLFHHQSEFKQGHKVLGHESKKHRGSVLFIQLSVDDQFVLVTYANQEFVLWSLQNFKEIYANKEYRAVRAYIVPVQTNLEYLQELRKEGYYEVLVLDERDFIVKIPLEWNFFQINSTTPIRLYKMGEPCLIQKMKEKRPALKKIEDCDSQPVCMRRILDIQIMDQILEEHIQCMDERESMNSQESRKNSSTKKPERRKSFFSKIFKTEDKAQEKVPQFIASSQYYLVAVGFTRRVQVMKVMLGNKLNPEQSKIQILLNFARPDAYIYDLVFNQEPAKSAEAQQLAASCACAWGLGNFKETNKRYVLLVVNWGGREVYAFKVMSSDFKIQVVQGGHFFNPIQFANIQKFPLICDFISNSILFTFNASQEHTWLLLMTTSQFEYGVPFTLSQIEKHTNQEKHIQSISAGQYNPKFYHFNNVVISQGVMDSINDGYQIANKLDLQIKTIQPNLQFFSFNENCYILNGNELYQIRLKKWDEYLYEMSESGEWEKCFAAAVEIHRGALTLLGNIPENDVQRHQMITGTYCELALRYMLLQLPNKQLRNNSSVWEVMVFLIETQNEEFLFQSIEDLLVGCGYRNVFYDYLRELLSTTQARIPHEHQLRVLHMFFEMGDKETVVRLIMSLQVIDFDPKNLVDFCLENDLLLPMMHICSLINDFLTPYLRILTLIQILEFQQSNGIELEDRQITTLSLEQLHQYLFSYISYCLTGQFQGATEQYFTDKQYKSMLKDLFEYLFDEVNIAKLFVISYCQSLQVFLYVFQPKIQEIFKALLQEGKGINVRVSVFVESQLADIIDVPNTPSHLSQLARIYALIKQAELTHYSTLQNTAELYSYSCAFTAHVLAICPLPFQPQHVVLNLKHYMGLLRSDSIFDISWVLRGRVQKDIPSEVIKNEFLARILEKLDMLPTNAVEELKAKANDMKWNWVQAWCAQKLGKIIQSFYIYLQDPEPLISERIFTSLAYHLKQNQEPVQEWVMRNLDTLAAENMQKTFQLLHTYCKEELDKILRLLEQMEPFDVDIKINQTRRVSLYNAFIEYLEPRMGEHLKKLLSYQSN